MTEKYTKEFILEYLKDYYITNKKTPISTDKNHPFSYKTVSNNFGSWGEALVIANIPLNINKSQKIKCKQCDKLFTKLFNKIKKSENHFCSRSCSAKYNNSNRIRSEETNNKTRLALQKSHKCILCENIIKGGKRKTCSIKCMKQIKIINGKINGSKGGVASAASQQRRSKNEIAFADLCIKYFGKDNVQCNEQIFIDKNGNKWDCDVYIKPLKIAILWDGNFWHGENASPKQKARDILKRKIIKENGCNYYTIIDYGKFKPEFVKEQFNIFIHKLTFTKVIDEITKKNNN